MYGVGHCAWRAAVWAVFALPFCTTMQAAHAQAAASQPSGNGALQRGAATKPPAKPSVKPGTVTRAGDAKQAGTSKPPAVPTIEQQCSGKGYWAREWCETKACFRAEHQYDPLCKQRREQRPVNQP